MSTADILRDLKVHARAISATPLIDLFHQDPHRFERFNLSLEDLIFDFSKHRINETTLTHLLNLAQTQKLEEKRQALFSGMKMNTTEQRAALHMVLRDLSPHPFYFEGQDIKSTILAEQARLAAFALSIREGLTRGVTGERLTDIVNIGIGGSDLGPAMATRALAPFIQENLRFHFVSNVDGADLGDLLKTLVLSRTLFIISSKTFTTLETMTNAHTARKFLLQALGEEAIAFHFVAVSTQKEKALQFGIAQDRIFGFWDWVGGRYSLWSSIGLPLMMGIGPQNFEAFLQGGYEVDQHFLTLPLSKNIPVIMALLGVWYRNILSLATQAVIPYDQRLARFPAYLQQLEMESNGKSVRHNGAPVDVATAPVIWGEPGTNGQHAFFQMLHQGTELVPIDFLIAAEPVDADPYHHVLLFANCLAQSEALMRGRGRLEVERSLRESGFSESALRALAPHKVFRGNRPSSTFLYHQLTPRTLGRLIALYEHKVFVQSVLWDINAFDQWGVELGKELTTRLIPLVSDSEASLEDLDSSTRGLIQKRRALQALS